VDDANRTPAKQLRTAVAIRPLATEENRLVPQLWNSAWRAASWRPGDGEKTDRNPYPLSAELWRERLGSKHHDQSLLLGAFEGGALVGAAYAKMAASHWQAGDVGWLALLCVDPRRQGAGLGSRLAAAAVRTLHERGCSHLRLGGEADHLLPGLPQEACPAAWRVARRLGCLPTNAEHDLLLDLRPDLPPAPLPPGYALRADRPAAALALVERSFPGRWGEEVTTYLAAGATAITLMAAGDDASGESAPAQGFCIVFQGDEQVSAPGLLWSEALLAELGAPATRLAGIGPLGVDPAVRGAGGGLAMVRGAAQWAKERGATDAIINWTTLTGFYGRLGARVWRTYQRVGGVIAASQEPALVAGAARTTAGDPSGDGGETESPA